VAVVVALLQVQVVAVLMVVLGVLAWSFLAIQVITQSLLVLA
jgi:hypothetical protein